MSLKARILLSFLGIALSLILGIGYFTYSISRTALEKETYTFLTSINQQKQARIVQWLNNATNQLDILAVNPVFTEFFFEHIAGAMPGTPRHNNIFHEDIVHNHLLPTIQGGQLFLEIFILRIPDGSIVISTEPVQEGKVMRNRAFFMMGQKQQFIENPFYSLSIRQPTMVISTPIVQPSGPARAVLAARLDLAVLSSIMEDRTGLKKTEESYLVDDRNYFLTEPRFGENMALRKTIYTEGVQAALRGESGVGHYLDYRDIPIIGAYIYLPSRNIALLTEIDRAEFMQPINALKNRIFIFGFFAVLCAVLLGWLLAEALYKPLKELIDSVNRVEGDTLDFTNPLTGRNELARLGEAFSETTVRLKETLVSRNLLEREIEQRKQVERRLKRALIEVNRSNKELEQFAYVASHDLQEPLRMVSSYTQLLADRYRDQLDEKAERFINYAVDGANRMQVLIQDLLAFSRITTKGKEFEAVDTHSLLGRTLVYLQVLINESKALVTTDDLPIVDGDKSQLGQLFQNLISNGIKFSRNELPRIHFTAERQGEMYLFSCRDNGIGIEAKFADRIFIIFQRLHTREEYSGTGIGLALCKRIVERHGGTIWFESKPGQGTTFYFTLKARAASGTSQVTETQGEHDETD